MEPLLLKPEFIVDFDGSIQQGVVVIHEGTIVSIGSDESFKGTLIPLPNKVLLPGFVNCHSHAFQRALRGLVEKKTGRPEHFFTWREKMYQLQSAMSKDDFGMWARLVYLEMLEAGFTHVGEFHYLHHDVQGPFKDPLAMSKELAQAALDVGINLVILECAYHRADFDEPIQKGQLRFYYEHVEEFLDLLKQAHAELSGEQIGIGAAIHSVRAVPESWFSAINDFAKSHNMPLHIHASEQEHDVKNSLIKTGLSPIGLLDRHHLLAPHTTLVHATHLINDDLARIKKGRPTICICPSTEKNLGDGVLPLADLFQGEQTICLGTDQHVRLDPFDEARSLEEQERLRLKKRHVLGKPSSFLYQTLIPCLTQSGMRSLIPTVTPTLLQKRANLIAVELPPEYAWHGPEVALDAMMLSHTSAHITHVWSNGHLVVHNKQRHYKEKSLLIDQLESFFKKINLSDL